MLNPVRRALLVLAICSFGLGTGEYAALGLLPDIAADLNITATQVGNLISAYALGVVIGAPVLAAVSVRLPRKGLLIALVVALAAGNLLSAVMSDFWSLLAVRFLAGLPHGAFFGLASVQAANLVPRRQRSQAMAIVFAGLTIANVVGVPMTTYIGQNTSWRLVFVLVAAVELLGVLGVLVAVPRSQRAEAGSSDLRTELRAFKNLQIWLALGIAMIGCGAIFTTFSYIAPMMTEVAGYDESHITPLLVLFGLGMTFGNLVGARLSDRYESSRVVSGVMAAQVVVAGVFYFTAGSPIASAVMIFLFPFCNTMAFPALQNRIITMAGGAPNLAAASMHAAFNVANSLGAWLGGLTIAAGMGYNSPNLVAVGLGATAAVIALYASRLQNSPAHHVGRQLSEVPPAENGQRVLTDRIPVLGLNTNPIPLEGRYTNTGEIPMVPFSTGSIPLVRHPGGRPARRRPGGRSPVTGPLRVVDQHPITGQFTSVDPIQAPVNPLDAPQNLPQDRPEPAPSRWRPIAAPRTVTVETPQDPDTNPIETPGPPTQQPAPVEVRPHGHDHDHRV